MKNKKIYKGEEEEEETKMFNFKYLKEFTKL